MNFRTVLVCVASMSLVGCLAGTVNSIPAKAPTSFENSILVNKSKAEVWAKAVPRLAKDFFVINNIDQTSGLINVSYSGDPLHYVDGGTIKSHVENARGPRDYSFPATSAHEQYELVDRGNLLFADRKMSLEGRVNVIVQEVGPQQTRITANVRYILTKSVDLRSADGRTGSLTDTASFNSGQAGRFPKEPPGGSAYYATGRLEADILEAFRMEPRMDEPNDAPPAPAQGTSSNTSI